MELKLEEKRKYVWELKKHGDMKVLGRVYGDEETVKHLHKDVEMGKNWNALKQIYNVACLPGIQKASLAMPDVHPGYGFPIGGVGAFNMKEGIISVGGVGFDVGCNVANIVIPVKKSDILSKQKELAEALFRDIPAGLGEKGEIGLQPGELDEVLVKGVDFVLKKGYGLKSDKEYYEKKGVLEGADPANVSDTAKRREKKQLGTLGSGNHYLEVQYVDQVFDEETAKVYGVDKDSIIVSMHCGSRALGHQIGTDYLRTFLDAMPKYGIEIKDKELACAPFNSPEGQDYYKAMACAANMAFANRQVITHQIRETFAKVFGKTAEEMEMKLVYDVAHNIAKLEKYTIDGEERTLLVHRKGATRAFGPSRTKDLPEEYQKIGQPVILGGSMETGSYLLAGTDGAEDTFGSTAHGAGRTMSRSQAKREVDGRELQQKMEKDGIYVHAVTMKGLSEEAGKAYKDIDVVVDTLKQAGITKLVVALKPIGNVKG